MGDVPEVIDQSERQPQSQQYGAGGGGGGRRGPKTWGGSRDGGRGVGRFPRPQGIGGER